MIQAPELFQAEDEQTEGEVQVPRNKQTDVYALGMVSQHTLCSCIISDPPSLRQCWYANATSLAVHMLTKDRKLLLVRCRMPSIESTLVYMGRSSGGSFRDVPRCCQDPVHGRRTCGRFWNNVGLTTRKPDQTHLQFWYILVSIMLSHSGEANTASALQLKNGVVDADSAQTVAPEDVMDVDL